MPFIYFSCLIALAKVSNAMLNRGSGNRHPCLNLEFRGMLFPPLNMMLPVSLLDMFFSNLRKDPFIPAFFRVFKLQGMLNFVTGFFCILSDHLNFILDSNYMVSYLY